VQTVDVIFPALPIYLYLNPALVKYLLDPLFENQEAGEFPQTYSIHDLGANYPRGVGHPTGDGGERKIVPNSQSQFKHSRFTQNSYIPCFVKFEAKV
jgi:hypothetical protein